MPILVQRTVQSSLGKECMKLTISPYVRDKIANKTPPVSETEILQCFANRDYCDLIDNRAEHRTNPITRWFIAQTDFGRKLKIAYMPFEDAVVIKSAYDAKLELQQMYYRVSRPL